MEKKAANLLFQLKDCFAGRTSGRSASGFTLIEMVLSVLIIMVLVTGAMAYQYHSTHDVKLAEIQAGAARLSMLLLESWKGTQGDEAFDPETACTELTVSKTGDGPAVPENGSGDSLTLLGNYEVELQNRFYYVTLSWYPASDREPKLLSIVVTWRNDCSQGLLEGCEAFVRYSTFSVD